MDDNRLGIGKGLVIGGVSFIGGTLFANTFIFHNSTHGTCSVAPNYGAVLVDQQVANRPQPLTNEALDIIERYSYEATAGLKNCSTGAKRVIDRVMERRIEFYRDQIN